MPEGDKVERLKSLKISDDDRDQDEGSGPGWLWLVIGLVFGLGLGGGGFYLFGPEKIITREVPVAQNSNSETQTTARRGGGLIASGYVIARRQATVAAEVTGRVTSVLVEEGQMVKAGDILATLDATLVKADLNSALSRAEAAKAGVKAIAAELGDAQRILNRTRSLEEQSFASNADLTSASARVATLEAQLARANADVITAQSDAARQKGLLEKYTITAPYDGVIIDKNAQAGEIISPVSAGGGFTRTGICTLVDMTSLEIEVDVNEAFIGRVFDNQKVTAVLDAYSDWDIDARVIATVPAANRDKATFRVRIAILEDDPRILPEMAVKVTFEENTDAL